MESFQSIGAKNPYLKKNPTIEELFDGSWKMDVQTGAYFCSIIFKKELGVKLEEYTIEAWIEQIHPEDQEHVEANLQQYLMGESPRYEDLYRVKDINDNYRWILSRGHFDFEEGTDELYITGTHLDITSYLNERQQLHTERELYKDVIMQAPVSVLIVDKRAHIVWMNRYSEVVSGYTNEEVEGKSLIDVFLRGVDKRYGRQLMARARRGNKFLNEEVTFTSKNGDKFTFLWNNSLLDRKDENKSTYVLVGSDITKNKRVMRQMHQLAYYDDLTMLPNECLLKEEAELQIHAAQGNGRKLAMVSIGIGNLKYINNAIGHEQGDRFLVSIAEMLLQQIPVPAMLARTGGDEFAVLINDGDYALSWCANIQHLFESSDIYRFRCAQQEFFASVSIGVSFYPEHGNDSLSLIRNASRAMQHARINNLQNYTVYHDDINRESEHYIRISQQIRSALKYDRFMLYYQPQIDLKTNKIISVEALLRLKDEKGKMVPPSDFIPFAEQNGMIDLIEEWTFRTACKQMMDWVAQGNDEIRMSINMSGKTLTKDNLKDWVFRVLDGLEVDFSRIELEITETAVMTNFNKAIRSLKDLKDLGVTIALDDFGTGYSSLTYLHKLPIDILKVDRSFVKDIMNEDEQMHIFNSIVDLAHDFGLKVVAEGVETKEQLNFVKRHACNIVQGYYFSYPLPVTEIERFIAEWKTAV